jgi:pilus assembly protein CpaF
VVARHDRVFVDRGGAVSLAPKWFSSPAAVERTLERLLARVGRKREIEAARAEGLLCEARIENGMLLTAALPPLSAHGTVLTFRRPQRDAARLADLVASGMLSQAMADLLAYAINERRNILVSGPADSHRTILLGALARCFSAGERIVSLEEGDDLDLGDGQWIQLLGGRGPSARRAIGNALRLMPALMPGRLVIGDVRGAEALDLIGALASGIDGVVCGVQASTAREAVVRLTSMARLAPEAPATETLAEVAACCLHLVVQIARSRDGVRRVSEIAAVTRDSIQPIYTFNSDNTDEGGGEFVASGQLPSWVEGSPPSLLRA